SWVYVLSSCVPDTDGKYAGGDTVEFRSSGIKNGLSGCQVRVKTLSSTAGETLDMPFEDRVLYWKKELTVTQEVDGTFVIKSDLARTYQPRLAPGVSTFKLVVDVKLPEGESGDGLRARLTCDPKIFEFGEFKTSWFTFHVRFLPEQTSYACSHIDVFKG